MASNSTHAWGRGRHLYWENKLSEGHIYRYKATMTGLTTGKHKGKQAWDGNEQRSWGIGDARENMCDKKQGWTSRALKGACIRMLHERFTFHMNNEADLPYYLSIRGRCIPFRHPPQISTLGLHLAIPDHYVCTGPGVRRRNVLVMMRRISKGLMVTSYTRLNAHGLEDVRIQVIQDSWSFYSTQCYAVSGIQNRPSL